MAYRTKLDPSNAKMTAIGGTNSDGVNNPTTLEGHYLGTKTTEGGEFGPSKIHFFSTKEGIVGVWGKSRLNSLLSKDLLGQCVMVTFTGMIKPSKKGRRPAYGYELKHDPSNTIDLTGLNLNAVAESEDEVTTPTNTYASSNDEETELYEDETPADVVTSSFSKSAFNNAVKATVTDAERQAKVQALLNRSKQRTA